MLAAGFQVMFCQITGDVQVAALCSPLAAQIRRASSVVVMRSREAAHMGQLDGYEVRAAHNDAAWTLHAWHDALRAANASVEAELYACASAMVVAQLEDCSTFQDLLCCFRAPDADLMNLLAWLCTAGEILLRPQLFLGVSCALRLHQLITEAVRRHPISD